jgi:hypothetical protein
MAKKSKSSVNRLVGAEPCSINSAEMRRYRAEEDVRTLQRAGEIKADASRLSAAKALAMKQANDLKKVCK